MCGILRVWNFTSVEFCAVEFGMWNFVLVEFGGSTKTFTIAYRRDLIACLGKSSTGGL